MKDAQNAEDMSSLWNDNIMSLMAARSLECMPNHPPGAVTTGTQFHHIYVMGRDGTPDERDWRLSRGVTSSFVMAYIKRFVQAGQVRTHGSWDTDLVVMPVHVCEKQWICTALTNMNVLTRLLLGNTDQNSIDRSSGRQRCTA